MGRTATAAYEKAFIYFKNLLIIFVSHLCYRNAGTILFYLFKHLWSRLGQGPNYTLHKANHWDWHVCFYDVNRSCVMWSASALRHEKKWSSKCHHHHSSSLLWDTLPVLSSSGRNLPCATNENLPVRKRSCSWASDLIWIRTIIVTKG